MPRRLSAHAIGGRRSNMEESFWELFQETGAPAFYLLYREECRRESEGA